MKRARLVALVAPGLALGAWLLLGAGGLYATLAPDQRSGVTAALRPLVATHGMLVVLWWSVGAGVAAWTAARLYRDWAVAAARMTDSTQTMTGVASAPDIVPRGAAPMRALAEAVNGLAERRRMLERTMGEQVRNASARVEQERDQLATLMAELEQSVVVCTLDGRVLLYNDRASALSRTVSQVPGARGAELIGLGRSIHALLDRGPIDHALATARQRLERGEARASARFVTGTPDGHLLRVNLAPVRPGDPVDAAPTGYVLLLDDITVEQQETARRDGLLIELTEASRASLASAQAALDMLDYPDLETADRERFQAVVRDEVTAMAARLDRLAADAPADIALRWPLQEMQGTDLLHAAARQIEAETGRGVAVEAADAALWLSVDGFALVQALAFLAGRIAGAVEAPRLSLRLQSAGQRAHLDLVWEGDGPGVEALRAWQAEPIPAAGGRPPPTVRDVVERHGGELWLELDRATGRPGYRFLLPVAEAAARPEPPGSRPEYYDFDLFAASAGSRERDDRALSELACTVFDTETTGLAPADGDEIIQVGAIRVLNGKLLQGECFDQLVDPRRSIPEAGIAIHGIRPETVLGKPTIVEVLPAFHAFAADTVLVGHNVAFDMRFLALKEEAAGVRFDQPVLDTLLLASLVFPNEDTHGLEAIAARLDVTPAARHTALGDARTTALVFLRLIPLLRQRGITTLGETRAASRTSFYASLRY